MEAARKQKLVWAKQIRDHYKVIINHPCDEFEVNGKDEEHIYNLVKKQQSEDWWATTGSGSEPKFDLFKKNDLLKIIKSLIQERKNISEIDLQNEKELFGCATESYTFTPNPQSVQQATLTLNPSSVQPALTLNPAVQPALTLNPRDGDDGAGAGIVHGADAELKVYETDTKLESKMLAMSGLAHCADTDDDGKCDDDPSAAAAGQLSHTGRWRCHAINTEGAASLNAVMV